MNVWGKTPRPFEYIEDFYIAKKFKIIPVGFVQLLKEFFPGADVDYTHEIITGTPVMFSSNQFLSPR